MGKQDSINFINQIKPYALSIEKKYGINAPIMIAQACLETAFGKRVCHDIDTKKDSKNLFNIKGSSSNGHVTVWTTEYYNGVKTKVKANFRAYKSYEESFDDFVKLMMKPRYKPCMTVKNNPDEFARKLKACGYATDPKYPQKLINIMNTFNLKNLKSEEVITLEDLNKMPWAKTALDNLKAQGIINSDHNLNEPLKWGHFVAVIETMYKKLSGK